MTWSTLTHAERVEKTRALVARGLSYNEIGRQLGTTKNAVYGLAHRQKIVAVNPQGPATVNAQNTKFAALKAPAPLPLPPENYWLPLPGSTPVAVADHHKGQCRWPVGRGLFCALPVDTLGPYCPAHHAWAWRGLPEVRKGANK